MKRIFLLFGLLSLSLVAARGHHHHHKKASFQDRDMDGVIDRYDRCPHTPFFALVNKNGCAIKKLHLSKEKEKKLKQLLSTNR
jgi:hypothetical protein